jgi:hypothetical protein
MAKHKRALPDVSESEVMPTEHSSVLTGQIDLINEIKETADKLLRDGATRGDLKILSRALRELRYAFKVFTPYRRQRKVTVFGSARTQPDHPAYQQSVEFGRRMAEEGWMILTGAGGGIMEGAHAGAGREMSMGVNIMLPFEQDANPVIAGDPKLVHMKYFFTRKLMFVKECDAVCCLPGGFGTLDEGMEVLTLLQTGKRDLCPVVFLDAEGGDFWEPFEVLVEHLLKRGMIAQEDLALYIITDDLEEAVDEILQFYHNYHSMRYVRDKLVLRVQRAPSPSFLQMLNEEFKDLLTDGEIVSTSALEEEQDQPKLNDLPRLVLNFNRRNLGRLRQLVDSLNHGSIKLRTQPTPTNKS